MQRFGCKTWAYSTLFGQTNSVAYLGLLYSIFNVKIRNVSIHFENKQIKLHRLTLPLTDCLTALNHSSKTTCEVKCQSEACLFWLHNTITERSLGLPHVIRKTLSIR